MRRPRPAVRVEAVAFLLLLTVLIAQIVGYGPINPEEERDPDGYVSYAEHLQATGTLHPAHRRLPGYPAFLVLIDPLTPGPFALDAFWVQGALMVVLTVVWWYVLRRRFGPLPALLFVAILALPSYLIRMVGTPMPDVPYTWLVAPLLVAAGWWTLAPSRTPWWWAAPLGLGLLWAQTIRPTTLLLALLFVPAVLAGHLIARWLAGEARAERVRVVAARAVTILLLGGLAFLATDLLLDTGARHFNRITFAYRLALTLPPAGAADATEADRRIEAGKAAFQETLGYSIDYARFLTYPAAFRWWEHFDSDAALAVGQERLTAHPLAYARTVVRDLRLNHYLTARMFVAGGFDPARMPVFSPPYPVNDGSPAWRVFWASGIVVPDRTVVEYRTLDVGVTLALARLATFWGLLGIGIWQAGRRAPGLTATVVLLGLGFSVAASATNTLDARYLLPFAPFMYLAQALGLAWIVSLLVGTPGPGDRPIAAGLNGESGADRWTEVSVSPRQRAGAR